MHAALDTSIFRLPIAPWGNCAEGAISNRSNSRSRAKLGFWTCLAQRIDLTGKGSLVTEKPYGAQGERLDRITRDAERLQEEIEARVSGIEVRDTSNRPKLSSSDQVVVAMKEVSPQFSLRNIARAERSVSVRKLQIRYAVWQDDPSQDFLDLRPPKFERPKLIDELSSQKMEKLERESIENIHGFEWHEHEHSWHYQLQNYQPFQQSEPERIRVDDISAEPAPPNRTNDGIDQHLNILRQLGQRLDGSS